MNDIIIYTLIALAIFIAYRKYTTYQVLKLVPSLLEQGGQIVDVRTIEEFKIAHKKGSINIPLDTLDNKMAKLDKTKPILLCCDSGSRSGLAKHTFIAKGFKDVYNVGGWRALAQFE